MIMEGQTLGMILAEGLGMGAGMARPTKLLITLYAYDHVKMLLHEWGYMRGSSLLLQLTYYINI